MIILNNQILATRLKIKKLQEQESYLLDLNYKFSILNNKYSDLELDKHRRKYYFIASISEIKDKKPYLIKDVNDISFYEKVEDKETGCFVYSTKPIYGVTLVKFCPRDPWSYKSSDSLDIYLDFFEILKSRKCLIKQVQNFIISKLLNNSQTKINNFSTSDKVQEFIDNLIFT